MSLRSDPPARLRYLLYLDESGIVVAAIRLPVHSLNVLNTLESLDLDLVLAL